MLEDTPGIADGAIVIGTNKNDAITFPDCRPEVYVLINEILNSSTKIFVQYARRIAVVTPLIEKTKDAVVKFGLDLGAPLHLTWTCYEGKDTACGRCDPCALRLWAFERNGVNDPIVYRADQSHNRGYERVFGIELPVG